MRISFATLLFASLPISAQASCPQFSPTLVELNVVTCNALRVDEVLPSSFAKQSQYFVGTIFSGEVDSSTEVTLNTDGSGLSYGRPALSPGRQYFVMTQNANLACPAALLAKMHFIVQAHRCSEGGEPTSWRGGFPFTWAKLESNPSQWHPLK